MFAPVIIKKILLTNPFDSPFYELSKLLIFASFIDFLPSLSLQLHTGRKRSLPWDFPVSRVVTWSDMTLHSLEPRLYPAKIGKWRPQEEPNMAYFETTSFFPTKDVVDVICRILLIRQLWFSFRWRVFFMHGKYWKTFWLEMSSPTSPRHSPVKNLVELTPVLPGGASDLQKTAKVIMLLRGLSYILAVKQEFQ